MHCLIGSEGWRGCPWGHAWRREDSADRLPVRNGTSKVFHLLTNDVQVPDACLLLYPKTKSADGLILTYAHESRIDN